MASDEQLRSRIIIEIVRRMAVGDAPDPLPSWQVVALDYEALFAGLLASSNTSSVETLQSREMAQERDLTCLALGDGKDQPLSRSREQIAFSRLQALFFAVHQAQEKVVLFINDFHWVLGGGGPYYSVDAPDLLVPALARREIQIIGACTLAQYREYIERFAAIMCRFQEILIPSEER